MGVGDQELTGGVRRTMQDVRPLFSDENDSAPQAITL
jgi:hypothetical protein